MLSAVRCEFVVIGIGAELHKNSAKVSGLEGVVESGKGALLGIVGATVGCEGRGVGAGGDIG